MKEGQTDFLDLMVEDAPAGATPTSEPTAAATPEPTDQGQPRTPDGKFAEKPKGEAEQVQQGVKPEAQPAPAPEPPSGDTSPHVPRAALEDERRKRQALEAQLAELRKTPAASAQSQPPQSPSPTTRGIQRPDIEYDEQNPREYYDQTRYWDRLEASWEFAVTQSSAEETQEAWDAFEKACADDPQTRAWSFSDELRGSRHPIGEVLKWRRKQKQLARFNEIGDVDAYIASEVQKRTANGAQPAPAAAAVAATPRAAPPTPPPSLAKGGAGSNDAPEMPNEDEVFNSVFGEKKTRKR